MEHSEKFEKVKTYYEYGVWDERRCRDAVVKKWITAEEFKEITGKDY